MKSAFISAALSIAMLLILFFFYHLPEIQNAFEEGKRQCEADTDTLFIPGMPRNIYRDTSLTIAATKPVEIYNDSIKTFFDTTFVSGRDSISITATISIKDSLSNWFMNIKHKDAHTFKVDTLKVFYPKYITQTITETNWLLTLIAFISGAITILLSIAL